MNAEKELRRLRKKWELGGRIGGRIGDPILKAAGTRIGMHNRWHVKRGVYQPKCKLCRKARARHTDRSKGNGTAD
jgi:hypothetical protein